MHAEANATVDKQSRNMGDPFLLAESEWIRDLCERPDGRPHVNHAPGTRTVQTREGK
jgi:hypothetical protein